MCRFVCVVLFSEVCCCWLGCLFYVVCVMEVLCCHVVYCCCFVVFVFAGACVPLLCYVVLHAVWFPWCYCVSSVLSFGFALASCSGFAALVLLM